MEYIIFGADDEARAAFHSLGPMRVACFADRGMAGKELEDRPVISPGAMLTRYGKGNSIIVVASSKEQFVKEAYLREHQIERYFVFSTRNDEKYQRSSVGFHILGKWQRMSWAEILMRYEVGKYRHIALCAIHNNLPFIMSEMAFQGNGWIVDCIVSDEHSGATVMGVPVVTAEEALARPIDCLAIGKSITDTDLREQVPDVHDYTVIDLMDIAKFVPASHHPELAKFKGIHKGERCFIVCNGPSLRMEDLDTLADHHVTCFGMNQIHKAFPLTKWRPDYWVVSDPVTLGFVDQEVPSGDYTLFYGDAYQAAYFGVDITHKEAHFFHETTERLVGKNPPCFSEDITVCCYLGHSVTYDCLQIAAYMGFAEIYLLGCDCTVATSGDYAKGDYHFVKDYTYEGEQAARRKYVNAFKFVYREYAGSETNPMKQWRNAVDHVIPGYEKAERYSRSHGFRIFNATRGGELEVFERVNFDDLFKG